MKHVPPEWRTLAEGLPLKVAQKVIRSYHSQTEQGVLAIPGETGTRARKLILEDRSGIRKPAHRIEEWLEPRIGFAAGLACTYRALLLSVKGAKEPRAAAERILVEQLRHARGEQA